MDQESDRNRIETYEYRGDGHIVEMIPHNLSSGITVISALPEEVIFDGFTSIPLVPNDIAVESGLALHDLLKTELTTIRPSDQDVKIELRYRHLTQEAISFLSFAMKEMASNVVILATPDVVAACRHTAYEGRVLSLVEPRVAKGGGGYKRYSQINFNV